LDNVSFSIPKGSVFGLLGPNGSGKTTLLSIVLDVLQANSGSYNWFGESSNYLHRKKIGSLLETPNLYHYLTAVQNLGITQTISGRGNEDDVHAVLEKVNLHERKNSRFSTYSLGMKQRLAIGAALLGNPDVLVFDEPTNGLDPVGIAEIRELIKKLSKEGKTIIMASHLLDEVEKVCTHVAILKQGTLITYGDVNEILINEDVVETSAADLDQLYQLLQGMPGKLSINRKEHVVQVNFSSGTADLAAVNRFCFDAGITITHLQLKKKSLETKFLELTH
jgi:ABC-2 type transport system ATP-binding protein